ncbi:MAG: HU family DNA-binding protein [Chloroflexi bacterium]|nr:HU family DNA-binding protein [Chloroflexota bacterium]
MNKSDLVQRIALENGLRPREVKEAVDLVLQTLITAIEERERVSLSSFGTFELREHREKMGRNPNTGEKLVLPPRPAVVFKPSRYWMKSLARRAASDRG